MDEVTGKWRKLQNEELHDQYSLTKHERLNQEERDGRGK
jgi:CRISPR/Cas system Type II protein with McrA/HNH and RuvC-like nuclease domain